MPQAATDAVFRFLRAQLPAAQRETPAVDTADAAARGGLLGASVAVDADSERCDEDRCDKDRRDEDAVCETSGVCFEEEPGEEDEGDDAAELGASDATDLALEVCDAAHSCPRDGDHLDEARDRETRPAEAAPTRTRAATPIVTSQVVFLL